MPRTIINTGPTSEGLPDPPKLRTTRTVDNQLDVGRTYPVSALDPDVRTDTEAEATTNVQFRLFAKRVQFIGEPYAPAGGVKIQAIPIEVTSDQAVRIESSTVRRIKVDIDSGTATGKKLRSADGKIVGAVDASIIVPIVKGRADIVFEAASTGTWVLGLDDSVDARAAELITTDVGDGTFT